MNANSHVPPGFRFHPTDEELVNYYLKKKIASRKIDLDVIKEVELYKIEPWDLQEMCRIGSEDQTEWYFFNHKDKKYPTGTRTNRATTAGFWKATGRDKPIYSKHRHLVGMRKTLVYYKGRAPNGRKSDWIMHEYRLETNEHGITQEEGWVVCKVFKKHVPLSTKFASHESPWYDEQYGTFIQELDSTSFQSDIACNDHHLLLPSYNRDREKMNTAFCSSKETTLHHQLPHLESPKVPNSTYIIESPIQSSVSKHSHQLQIVSVYGSTQADDQMTDWRILDKFVASQLSHDLLREPVHCSHISDLPQAFLDHKQDMALEYTSTSTSSCQSDPYFK